MRYNMKQALKLAEYLEELANDDVYSKDDWGDIVENDECLIKIAVRFMLYAKIVADKDLTSILNTIDVSIPEDGDGEFLLSKLMVAVDYLRDMEDVEIAPLSEIEQFYYQQLVLANAVGRGVSKKDLLDCYESYDSEDDEDFSENTLKDIIKRLITKRGIKNKRGIGYFDPRVLPVKKQQSVNKKKP